MRGPPKFCSEARGELQRRRAASEILEEILELGLEGGFGFSLFVDALELVKRDHESFGDVAAAVRAEAAGDAGRNGELRGHGLSELLYLEGEALRQGFEVWGMDELAQQLKPDAPRARLGT